MFNAIGNAVGNVLAKIFPDSVAGGKKPSGGNKGQGKKGGGNPQSGGGNPSQGMRSRRVQEASAPVGARSREMSQKTTGRLGSYIEPTSLTAGQGIVNGSKQGKSAIQQRGSDGRTEGEKAADAATMNSGSYDQNGYVPQEGDNDTLDVLNKRIKDDIASGKLKFADGYDSSDTIALNKIGIGNEFLKGYFQTG